MRYPGITSPETVPRHAPVRHQVRTADKAGWYLTVTLATDACGVLLPFLTVYSLHRQPHTLIASLVATATWLSVRTGHLRYSRRTLAESRGLLASLHDWCLLLGALAVLRVLTGESAPVVTALSALVPALFITAVTGALLHTHLTAARHQAQAVQRVLIVGEPGLADTVAAQLAARTDHPYVVVGAVPVGTEPLTGGVPEAGRLAARPMSFPDPSGLGPAGDGENVLWAARRTEADQVLVAPGAAMTGDRLRRLAWALHDAGMPLVVTTGLSETALRRVRVSSVAGLALLHVAPPTRRGPQVVLKEVMDRAGAALGLLLLAPLFAVLALAVRLDSRGPAFYRQTRIGHHGMPFTMWKFRTMVPDADRLRTQLEPANESGGGPLFKLRSDPRVTRVGRLLRRSSLDELPQLLNVLLGQMSLVGPRPALPEEVARYSPVERRRLQVKPGLTGPWQVGGRSDLSWDESVALDVSYADNWSVTEDLDVLSRTFRAVVEARGAY
ncbi:sugar transferase [Streptomyces sp. YIM 98790]|uniref:sugar transferase n=1 Tax=Streptomyces sp. YIM 98790 TaxID=2689077 RepID=UPI00140B8AB3|nr:sugar transferase [Streptomyces sp. YIM 98790]